MQDSFFLLCDSTLHMLDHLSADETAATFESIHFLNCNCEWLLFLTSTIITTLPSLCIVSAHTTKSLLVLKFSFLSIDVQNSCDLSALSTYFFLFLMRYAKIINWSRLRRNSFLWNFPLVAEWGGAFRHYETSLCPTCASKTMNYKRNKKKKKRNKVTSCIITQPYFYT